MKPQQNSKSIAQLISLSASGGRVFAFVSGLAVADVLYRPLGLAGVRLEGLVDSSSSSSSSMTNCGCSSAAATVLDPPLPFELSCISSLSQRTFFSKTSNSPSNTTGSTLCRTRRQLSASFVGSRSLASADPTPAEFAAVLINDEASEETPAA